MSQWLLGLFLLIFIHGCARAPLKDASRALRVSSAPELSDDLPLTSLFDAVSAEIAFLEKSAGSTSYRFGPKTLSKTQYIAGLKRFLELGKSFSDPKEFFFRG